MQGGDIFKRIAGQWLQVAPDDVTPEQRARAKAIVYGGCICSASNHTTQICLGSADAHSRYCRDLLRAELLLAGKKHGFQLSARGKQIHCQVQAKLSAAHTVNLF